VAAQKEVPLAIDSGPRSPARTLRRLGAARSEYAFCSEYVPIPWLLKHGGEGRVAPIPAATAPCVWLGASEAGHPNLAELSGMKSAAQN
jgi:hypothetical protein